MRYERKQVETCFENNTIKDSTTNQAFKEHKKMKRKIQEKTGRKRNHAKLSRQKKTAREGNFTFMKKVSRSNQDNME